ncbi:MAG: hypothetical protein ABSB15_25500 [Bryobacteraceae bacterium]|jgi:hypothetical protein
MFQRSMLLDAFRPTWGWNARLRAADPADRWKMHLLRIGAGLLIVVLFCLLGGLRHTELR